MLNRVLYLIILCILAITTHLRPTYITTFSFYAYILCGLFDGLTLYLSAQRIQIKHSSAHSYIYKHAPVDINTLIINRSFMLIPKIDIHFIKDKSLFNLTTDSTKTTYLYPHSKQKNKITYRYNYLGPFHAGIDYIELSSFLGLFKTSIKPKSSQRINVYPNTFALDYQHLSPLQDEVFTGHSLIANQNDEFKDTRSYQMGDPLNRIHWKLSAKAQTLITKEYQDLSRESVRIWLDTMALNVELSEFITMRDFIVECANAFVQDCLSQKIDIKLLNEQSLTLTTCQDYLTYFAALEFNKNSKSAANHLHTINQIYHKRLYIFTLMPSKELIHSIKFLLDKGADIYIVLPTRAFLTMKTELTQLKRAYFITPNLTDTTITFKDIE